MNEDLLRYDIGDDTATDADNYIRLQSGDLLALGSVPKALKTALMNLPPAALEHAVKTESNLQKLVVKAADAPKIMGITSTLADVQKPLMQLTPDDMSVELLQYLPPIEAGPSVDDLARMAEDERDLQKLFEGRQKQKDWETYSDTAYIAPFIPKMKGLQNRIPGDSRMPWERDR